MVLPRTSLPHLANGCGCCSLKTCCYVQGYFMLFNYIAAIFLSVDAIANPCGVAGVCTQDLTYFGFLVAALVVNVLFLMSTILFLRGIFQGRPGLLKPYIYSLIVSCALIALATVATVNDAFEISARVAVGYLLGVGIHVYLLVHAESLYYNMIMIRDASQLAGQVEDGVVVVVGGASPGRGPAAAATPASLESAPPAYSDLLLASSSKDTLLAA